MLAKGILLAGIAAQAGTSADELSSVEEVIAARGSPDFFSTELKPCLGYFWEDDRGKQFAFLVFPLSGGAPREMNGLDSRNGAAIAAACGPAAGRFVDIVSSTCSGGLLRQRLSDPALLTYVPPLPKEIASKNPPMTSFFGRGLQIGCARTVTSRDNRVRIWIPIFERIDDAAPLDEEGLASGKGPSTRGLAYVQWKDEVGRIHVDLADADLHLDAVVDALEPLPGPPNHYLVLGFRSYLTTYPGDLLRRYAFVIELGDGGPRLVPGAIQVGPVRRDVLLLDAPIPTTGKARHSALAAHFLDFVPTDRTIRIASFPGAFEYPGPHPNPNALVARWDGTRFRVQGTRWGSLRLANAWARPLADRP